LLNREEDNIVAGSPKNAEKEYGKQRKLKTTLFIG